MFSLIKSHKKELKSKKLALKSKVAAAKMFEIFFESGPQFILQLTFLLQLYNVYSFEELGTLVTMNIYSAILKIMTLTTSFVSLFKGAMGVFKNKPLTKINDKVKKMPHFTWKSNIVLFISFMMTILPRLLSLSVFFACCDGFEGPMAFFMFSLVYVITFIAFTLPKYQSLKTNENY